METINTIIANRRQDLGLSQEQIARAVGVTRATVCRWEKNNIINIKSDKIAKLAKVLKLDISSLVDPPQAKSPARGQGDITVHGDIHGIIGDNGTIIHAGSDEKHGEICDMYQALPEDARKHINWLIQAEYEKNKKG